jgi:hypothetical protein
MNQNRFARRVALVAGVCFLCEAPQLSCAQSRQPALVQAPPVASPAARQKRDTRSIDYFGGLSFTADQKETIDTIHRNIELRIDATVKDRKLDTEQSDAMIDGLRRMERGQIFQVLTPEQQKEVRKRIQAQRVAEQEKKKKFVPE